MKKDASSNPKARVSLNQQILEIGDRGWQGHLSMRNNAPPITGNHVLWVSGYARTAGTLKK